MNEKDICFGIISWLPDKETDRQLAGKINASKLEAEVQAQFKKSNSL